MKKQDKKTVEGIETILNSPDSTSKELVSTEDIIKIVENGLRLYSWGNNGIRFAKDEYEGLYLGRGEQGYNVQVQYVYEEPERGCFVKDKTEEFFRSRGVSFQERGQLRTEDLPVDLALNLFHEFENVYWDLSWYSEDGEQNDREFTRRS